MHSEMVVARSHDEASIFTNYEISREFVEAQARTLNEGPRFKKLEESWLAVHSRVYLIAQGNLMSRTKCT